MCKGCIPRYPFCVRKDKRGGSGIGGRAFRPWHRSGVLRSLRIHYSSEQVLIRLVGSPKPVWEVLLIWNILWSNWSFGLACYVVFVQSLSHIQLFMIPRTAARQASSSFTISWSFLKLMSIESVVISNPLILCCPLLLPPWIFLSIQVFSNEVALHIRWSKYWSFSFSIGPSNEYSCYLWYARMLPWWCRG